MNGFQKLSLAALVSVILLIFVGAIVRVTGSGLGCPDWPRCWGCYIPPTSVEQVNMDDAAFERIKAKAVRLGRPEHEVTRESLLREFNPVHTWIEYINRLTSLPVGFLTLGTFIGSFYWRERKPFVFWGATAAFAIVIFNALLGRQVVYSGLKPGIITLHMALAFLLISLQVMITWQATARPWKSGFRQAHGYSWLGIVLLILVLAEGVLGSQVRELTDQLAKSHFGHPRSEWTLELENSWLYLVHRSFSWLIVVVAVLMYWKARQWKPGRSLLLEKSILGMVLTMMLMGIVMAHWGVFPWVQVLHVGLTSVLLSACVFWVCVHHSRR